MATLVIANHGVKGQKWGERKYQYEDGSLTPEGKKHYGYGDAKRDTFRRLNNRDRLNGNGAFQKTAGNFWLGNRTTYEMAREAGHGKLRSYLKANFDIGVSDLAAAGTALTTGAALTAYCKATHTDMKDPNIINGIGAISSIAGFAARNAVSESYRKAGKVDTLNQHALVQKIAKKTDKKRNGN